MAIITAQILPGTIILSDRWGVYNGIQQQQGQKYTHLTVNHTYNFVDPISRTHTQNVENMWSRAKRRNKRHNGTHRQMLESYLCEFMWRQNLNGRIKFDVVLDDIVAYWPPGD